MATQMDRALFLRDVEAVKGALGKVMEKSENHELAKAMSDCEDAYNALDRASYELKKGV